jgi:GDP-L-fucose synthase
MNKIKVLLTGASGMVGSNLLEHPYAEKFNILTPSRQELNLLDSKSIKIYLNHHLPDIVIHAAGKVGGVQANLNEPVSYLMDNLDMGRNIVWGSRQAGIRRLINLGSSCMYPRNYSKPLSEDMMLKAELEPTNEGYALAKIVTARLCEYIVREDSSYQYKTLIPCNLYGRHDKFNTEHSHLLPAIIHKMHQAIKTGQKIVEIWGDGTARREFMYAADLADALIRSITHFDTLPSYMNVGLGCDFTINEYYKAAADVMGYTGSFVHNISKPVGMARKLVNIERQVAWGWVAKNDLITGLEKTYEFYLKEHMQ